MKIFKFNDKEYDADAISDVAKSQLVSLQAVHNEIERLNMQLAFAQTARNAYAQALQAALPAVPQSDTVKFSN